MKLFAYLAIVVLLFAHMIMGYEDYGQGRDAVEDFCLSEPCEKVTPCPEGLSWDGESCVAKCQCED
uniref:Uncharacterized protein n=1 Tax=Anopheles stephensi TaxID=30069 RepID=A0A182YJ77_ANOST